MRFLADESCDDWVVKALRKSGRDVAAILAEGAPDQEVFARARREHRIYGPSRSAAADSPRRRPKPC